VPHTVTEGGICAVSVADQTVDVTAAVRSTITTKELSRHMRAKGLFMDDLLSKG
jgi:hypothetical protein